jgi:hypothetical protein
MLGLKLRPEFAGTTITGTVVSLNAGVPDSFPNLATAKALEITYPTVDLLQALEACFSQDSKRYLVIMGERGQGKSHIMGVIHHAFKEPVAFMAWLDRWKSKLSYDAKISQPPKNFLVLTTALHEQGYEYLWSPIFKHHPEGARLEGKWEARRETMPVPAKQDIIEALEKKPVALIFDEFQTWYANLHGKAENWAFNFIQILSDIAKERPELLRLVVSVRDGESDAYKQLHRQNPSLVNFKGAASKQDRQKLLIHRLFENRGQISNDQIKGAISIYFTEWCRLLAKSGPEVTTLHEQMVTSWPYSLDLLNVLEEQIAMATHAQETRDLILVLAYLFRALGENEPIITPAHFGLDEHRNQELDRLIAAIGTPNTQKLAKIALQNIKVLRETLRESFPPMTERALASLYVRSLTMGKQPGATREQIQADLSASQKYEDNQFKDQWAQILDNSYNVHEKQGRYFFDIAENARTKVLAHARNAKLFEQGQDLEKIMAALEWTFAPKNNADRERFRWSVLGPKWRDEPFRGGAFKGKNPSQDLGDGQPCYVFIPEALTNGNLKQAIGKFQTEHIPRYKNLVRFVIPNKNIFEDKAILLYARALYFSEQWKDQPEYLRLKDFYEAELSKALSEAFKSVMLVERWDAQNFHNIQLGEIVIDQKSGQMFTAVDQLVEQNHFSIDDFNALIDDAVKSNHLERQKLSFLRSIIEEPRPFPNAVIPWTNPTHIFDVIMQGVLESKYAVQTNAGVIQVSPARPPDQVRRDVPRPQWNRWDSIHVVPLQGGGGTGIPFPSPTSGTPSIGGSPVSGPSPTNPMQPEVAIGKIVRELGYRQSALQAIGELERWGINKSAKLHDVNIVFTQLSGEQLKKVLQVVDGAIPDGEIGLRLLKEEEQK